MININISNQQSSLEVDETLIRQVICEAMVSGNREHAEINLAIVDDPTIHEMNLRFLNHDYPTDVISFVMEETPQLLEGEVAVSADTALQVAQENSWNPQHELLLYIVHGCLHLVGFNDTTTTAASAMRKAEKLVLGKFDIVPAWDERTKFGVHLTEGE